MTETTFGDVSWERMANSVERVRERLLRTARVLENAGIPYAIAGGNAVAAWVSRVDEAAVRNTQDVDVLLRRTDLNAARAALELAGYSYRHAASLDMFLDGPNAKARDAVHVVFAGERVREHYAEAAPDVDESIAAASFRLLSLEALVRMKLTSFRDKDRMHLRDLADVGLIDAGWTSKFIAPLAGRLQAVIDDPDG